MSMYQEYDYNICKLINRLSLNLITFGHAIVDRRWNGRICSPVYSRLYYIIGGDSFITIADNKKRINLEPGKWYLIPTGCSFDYECIGEMEHYYFHLKLTDFDGTDILRKCEKPLFMHSDSARDELCSDSIFKNDLLSGLMLKQKIFSVLLDIISKNNVSIKSEGYSGCVINAIRYIKDNLSVRLTIAEISESIFVSKSTLTKHFKKELFISVNGYIYELVMSKAEYLITSTNETIQSISEKFGFCDQFHFSRRFKEKFGLAPGDYRKKKPI